TGVCMATSGVRPISKERPPYDRGTAPFVPHRPPRPFDGPDRARLRLPLLRRPDLDAPRPLRPFADVRRGLRGVLPPHRGPLRRRGRRGGRLRGAVPRAVGATPRPAASRRTWRPGPRG